jgi:hypothetical protein
MRIKLDRLTYPYAVLLPLRFGRASVESVHRSKKAALESANRQTKYTVRELKVAVHVGDWIRYEHLTEVTY